MKDEKPKKCYTRKDFTAQVRRFHPKFNPACYDNSSQKFKYFGMLNPPTLPSLAAGEKQKNVIQKSVGNAKKTLDV